MLFLVLSETRSLNESGDIAYQIAESELSPDISIGASSLGPEVTDVTVTELH